MWQKTTTFPQTCEGRVPCSSADPPSQESLAALLMDTLLPRVGGMLWPSAAERPALPLFSPVWGVAERQGTDFLPGTSCKGKFRLFCMNTPNACGPNNGHSSCFPRDLVLFWPWEVWFVVFMAPPGGQSRKGVVGLGGRNSRRTMMTYLLLPFSLLALGCVVPGQPFSTRFWVGSGVQGATGEGTFLGGPASSSRMHPGLGPCLNRWPLSSVSLFASLQPSF